MICANQVRLRADLWGFLMDEPTVIVRPGCLEITPLAAIQYRADAFNGGRCISTTASRMPGGIEETSGIFARDFDDGYFNVPKGYESLCHTCATTRN